MFNLETFLLDLTEIGPAVIGGVLALKNETPGVSKTQLASDSAKLALGITTALSQNDPVVLAAANQANSIIESIVKTIAASTQQKIT
jgi:hypothetical protein